MSNTVPLATGIGYLRMHSYTATKAFPVPNVEVEVTLSNGTVLHTNTGPLAIADDLVIACPPKSLSLDPNNTTQIPYETCDVVATLDGFQTFSVSGVQIFDEQTSLLLVNMIPAETSMSKIPVDVPDNHYEIPVHNLFAGTGGSGPAPIDDCLEPAVLSQPIIPYEITVHLGSPSSGARNITLPFRDYIKNVASSEVYPTWPEQSLRANIHAQISLALNRVYTEWYKSKGYSFQITNSTSYDQYFVEGRDIFEVMSEITDDIFNTYVRREGNIDPYYTEYCDGQQVSCKGMKQWGTVDLAENGMNALSILQYYYGNNIEIVRTNNIEDIPESYPGTPLRVGSTGTAVSMLQRQLNRIAKNYPSFGAVSVDGIYGEDTAEVVRKFQRQFSLTVDGVTGQKTWYKISYIYVSIKKLAELSSEGEQPSGDLVTGEYPGTALRIGSTGDNVERIQFWLNEVAEFFPGIPTISVDGIFGQGTYAAVRAFQQEFGLTVDGVVGRATWEALYDEYVDIQDDITPPDVDAVGEYPGTPLRQGSRGNEVKQFQFWLRVISNSNSSISTITADGIFGNATTNAVRQFQSFYGLIVDGVVGELTWNKIFEVYTGLINEIITSNERPGTYPGTALRLGSTGRAVKEMQYYLHLLSAYYVDLPDINYDGIFGPATEAAVRIFQNMSGLTVDGIVGRNTWNSIYSQFSHLRNFSGVVRAMEILPYPNRNFAIGSRGDDVAFIQQMLEYIGHFYETILPVGNIDGIFGTATANSVKSFQQTFSLQQTGVVDETTWSNLVSVYQSMLANRADPWLEKTEYPGYVSMIGSSGQTIQNAQLMLGDIATQYCDVTFSSQNGYYNKETHEAIKSLQAAFRLPSTGFIDHETWSVLTQFSVIPTEV